MNKEQEAFLKTGDSGECGSRFFLMNLLLFVSYEFICENYFNSLSLKHGLSLVTLLNIVIMYLT
jgi:hypothetical protein